MHPRVRLLLHGLSCLCGKAVTQLFTRGFASTALVRGDMRAGGFGCLVCVSELACVLCVHTAAAELADETSVASLWAVCICHRVCEQLADNRQATFPFL
jgi:hypothetical protein